MLPSEQLFFWQQLLSSLTQLERAPLEDITTGLTTAREIFESQILPQASDLPSAPATAKIRSYLTEMHRLFRLLQTDVLLIRSAKSSDTLAQRERAYKQRLTALQEFCQAAILEGRG
jgi:hypothetical protein